MSVDEQGDLRIDSWLIKIFLTNPFNFGIHDHNNKYINYVVFS